MGYGTATLYYGCPVEEDEYEWDDSVSWEENSKRRYDFDIAHSPASKLENIINLDVCDDDPVLKRGTVAYGNWGQEGTSGAYLYFWQVQDDSIDIEEYIGTMKDIEAECKKYGELWSKCLQALGMEHQEPKWHVAWYCT
jgi:hypothetical protein